MFGPRQISTPNINKDIHTFFYPESDFIKVSEMIESLDGSSKTKLFKLTERLEFIYHLLLFREELIKKKSTEIKVFKVEKTVFEISKIDHIRMFNKNFDGVDYDIESLVLYLLLTCIDTLAGQDEYIPFSDWLETNKGTLKEGEINLAWIKNKEKEHKEIFGIGRNFKHLLVNGISEELKKRATTNFAVAKLDNGRINKNSWKAWETSTNDEKMKKIAKVLFEQVRNKYTHTSHRTFLPNVNVKYLSKTDYPVLLSVTDDIEMSGNLIFLLLDIVKYIIRDSILIHHE